jgi:hypothetical protein
MKTSLSLAAVIVALAAPTAPQESEVDKEGFIRNWLVLAPIRCEGENSGADEIVKEQIKDEGKLKPKAGEKITVGGKELEWKKAAAADYYFDFNVWLKKPEDQKEENVIGYLCCTIVAAEEMKGLEARMGSNDQGRLYINGKELLKFTETRTIDKDSDVAKDVTLVKGENTVVFKVLNESNNWQGCLRFTDKSGAPVKNIKVALAAK